jgi:hypothetical protein
MNRQIRRLNATHIADLTDLSEALRIERQWRLAVSRKQHKFGEIMDQLANGLIALAVICVCGCSKPTQMPPLEVRMPTTNNPHTVEVVKTDALVHEHARALSDCMVADLVADRREEAYSRMESDFRQINKMEQFELSMNLLFAPYGRPIDAEFKAMQAGTIANVAASATRPMLKLWYAVTTTKHKRGNHFIFVEVVSDQDRLAIRRFSIVGFPGGPPSYLK